MPNQDQMMGLIRHAVTVVGTIFVAKGKLDLPTLESVAGALAVVGGIVWSYMNKAK